MITFTRLHQHIIQQSGSHPLLDQILLLILQAEEVRTAGLPLNSSAKIHGKLAGLEQLSSNPDEVKVAREMIHLLNQALIPSPSFPNLTSCSQTLSFPTLNLIEKAGENDEDFKLGACRHVDLLEARAAFEADDTFEFVVEPQSRLTSAEK